MPAIKGAVHRDSFPLLNFCMLNILLFTILGISTLHCIKNRSISSKTNTSSESRIVPFPYVLRALYYTCQKSKTENQQVIHNSHTFFNPSSPSLTTLLAILSNSISLPCSIYSLNFTMNSS